LVRTQAQAIKSPRKRSKRSVPKNNSASSAAKHPLGPKATQAVRRCEELLWGLGVTPHRLLQELHEVLLLRCLKEADGNYAAAAAMFGPSRQSVQQYANSPLRDDRWRAFQQNRRKKRGE
jgi:DNA-binding protein Fis